MGPNENKFKGLKEEDKEQTTIKQEVEEEITEVDENIQPTKVKSSTKSNFSKMLFTMIIIIAIIVVIGFFISIFTKKDYTYEEVEDIMKKAAQSYFIKHKSKLPENSSQTVEIHDDVLANEGYMKTMDKYFQNKSCSGKVIVQQSDDDLYSYNTYLDCGDSYKTKELYQQIINKNKIVTEGYGLYQTNNGYVYKGKEVDNYVKFKNSDIIWRIVKIDNNNEIVLIQDRTTANMFTWDTRYNDFTKDNTGINLYQNSTISSTINNLYESKYEDDYLEEPVNEIPENIKSKFLKFNVCVGRRSKNDTTKDGSVECSSAVETTFGLLSAYEFLNASIDPNCTTTTSPACQNYNYLATGKSFWLANGSLENTNKVFNVNASGYISANYGNVEKRLKIVVHIDGDNVVESGKGTSKKPYIIR